MPIAAVYGRQKSSKSRYSASTSSGSATTSTRPCRTTVPAAGPAHRSAAARLRPARPGRARSRHPRTYAASPCRRPRPTCTQRLPHPAARPVASPAAPRRRSSMNGITSCVDRRGRTRRRPRATAPRAPGERRRPAHRDCARGDERWRRVGRGDGFRTHQLGQYRRESAGTATDVEHPHAGFHTRERGEPRRELPRVAAHEGVVRVGRNGEHRCSIARR